MSRSVFFKPIRAAAWSASLLSSGCQTSLGTCDDERAHRVVYTDDADGFPAYEGQAIVLSSCGGGNFCHAAAASGSARYGVPKGLDFDVHIASSASEVTRLARAQKNVYAWRHEIFELVRVGSMPPGERARTVIDGSAKYADLPQISNGAAHEILRNWLACGSPVIERTMNDRPADVEPVGEVLAAMPKPPPEPTWPSIYENLIVSRRCNSSECHSAGRKAGALDLSSLEVAYSNLVGRESQGPDCGNTGSILVAPNAPGASLLIHKLDGFDASGNSICGERMPVGSTRLSDEVMAPIREWIDAGASFADE